jgi:MATE family multidrug resistance protein
MKVNFVGYWLFGLPIGYVLCFHLGLGVRGLWWGLTMALIVISLVLLAEWNKQTKCAP